MTCILIDVELILEKLELKHAEGQPQYALVISDLFFIYHYFIPFLSNLKFCSKKELDFKDWVLGVKILVKGLHKLEEGKSYMLNLISKMNWGRLNSGLTSTENRGSQNLDINHLNHNSGPPEVGVEDKIFTYSSLYKFGSSGELIEISTNKIITSAKFYKIIPIFNLNNSLLPCVAKQGWLFIRIKS